MKFGECQENSNSSAVACMQCNSRSKYKPLSYQRRECLHSSSGTSDPDTSLYAAMCLQNERLSLMNLETSFTSCFLRIHQTFILVIQKRYAVTHGGKKVRDTGPILYHQAGWASHIGSIKSYHSVLEQQVYLHKIRAVSCHSRN